MSIRPGIGPQTWEIVRTKLDQTLPFANMRDTPYYRDAVWEQFSKKEYERRYRALRNKMQEQKLDAVIVPGGPSHWSFGGGMLWLTGHWEWHALASYVLFPILFSVGLRHTTASHAALIHASTPLFTGIIAAALERSWPRGWWWTGVAVALIGEALLIGLGRGFDEPGVTLYGDLVVFIACVAVAFGYVAGGSLSRTLGSLAVTLWGVALAALIIAPGLLVVPVSGLLDAPASALGGLAFLVLISSVIGYVAWNWALAHGGIGRTGVLMFAQPILSVILAVLLLGESITLSIGVPAAIILAGVAIARRG